MDRNGAPQNVNFVDVRSFFRAYTKLTLSGAFFPVAFITEYVIMRSSVLLLKADIHTDPSSYFLHCIDMNLYSIRLS